MTTTTRPARLPLGLERLLDQQDFPSSPASNDNAIVLGNLCVDLEGFRAEVDDAPLSLTTQEFSLLAVLALRAGRLVASEALAGALWQEPKDGFAHHLGVVMARLRSKLSASYPYRIETVRNRGFVLKSAHF